VGEHQHSALSARLGGFKNLLWPALALAGISLAVGGCAETEELETLEEQTGVVTVIAPPGRCWSGAIGDSTKEGCGRKEFVIEGEAIIAANAQKTDPGRWQLTITLEVDGEEKDRATTDAQFGLAQVSE
jgi:hypothetical protein